MQELPKQSSSGPSQQPQPEVLGQQANELEEEKLKNQAKNLAPKSEQRSTEDDKDDEGAVSVSADIKDSSGNNFISGRDTKNGDLVARDKIVNIFSNNWADIQKDYEQRRRPPPPAADASLEVKTTHWFMNELEPSQQIIVMVLGMFNELPYEAFLRVYETIRDAILKPPSKGQPRQDIEVIDNFLSDGEKCRIVFEHNAEEVEEHIKFKEPECKDAVWKVIRQQQRSLLLKLLPTLRLIGERQNREIRVRAAEAIAEIGKMSFEAIKSGILEYWARDKRGYVRAAVGYTLARLYSDAKTRKVALNTLTEWSDPKYAEVDGGWRLHWTVASVYKQIGFSDAQAAYEGLKKIACYPDIRVADSVIYTFVVLSLEKDRLVSIVELLGKWAEEGTGNTKVDQSRDVVCRVAILTFLVLAQLHIETLEEEINEETEHFTARSSDLFRLVREHKQGNLWHTIISIGIRALENGLKDSFFGVFQLWSNNPNSDEAKSTWVELMFSLFGQSRSKYRQIIYNRLSRWEQQTNNKNLAGLAKQAKRRINSAYG